MNRLIAIPCILGLLLAACASKPKNPEGSGMGSEWQNRQASPVTQVEAVDNLSKPLEPAPAAPEGQRVYRFILTGHHDQRLDLTLFIDGKESCRLAGRLDAEIHKHEYSKIPRVDGACVVLGPVANEEHVKVHLQGFVMDAGGVKVPVDQKVETDFVDMFDGAIDISEDGQAEISFPKG